MENENNINNLSIAAFIFSFLLFPVGLILSIIGMVKSKKYRKENGVRPKYFVFSIIGLVISILGFLITLFITGIVILVVSILVREEKNIIGNYTCYYPYSYRPAVSAEFKNGSFKWSKYNDEIRNSVNGTYKLRSAEIKDGIRTYKIKITPKNIKTTTKVVPKKNYDVIIKNNNGKITITFDNGTTYNCSKRDVVNEF